MSEIKDIPFKEKPDIAQVFLRQMDRNNQAALLGPDIHEASTRQTLSNLPTKWRNWVKDQADKYTNYDPRWKYVSYQSHKIGTPEDPYLIDKSKPVRLTKDGEIDWTDPNIYSPHPDTGPDPIDPHEFNDFVNEAAESASLSWTPDEPEVDAGDTWEHVERKKQPLWWRDLKREQEAEEDEEEALQDSEGEG